MNPFKICNVFVSLSKITSKRGEKVKVLIPKVFLRLIIHSRSFSVEKLELPYSGSYRSEFQDKCLFVYFLTLVKFFGLRPMTKSFTFLFHKCKISREFCRLSSGSWHKNHEF